MEQQTLFEIEPAQAGARVSPASCDVAPTPPSPHPEGHLDAVQARAVAHRGGALLVLGGPGTGKTTTVVEVAVGRLAAGCGCEPGRVLVLAASREAAANLRAQIGRRLGGGALPVVSTFHAFALGALRAFSKREAGLPPLRLLTAGEQESRLRELLGEAVAAGRVRWPDELSGALGTRGIAAQARSLIARARGLGLDGPGLVGLGRRHKVSAWQALGGFLEEYLDILGFEGVIDYQELVYQAMVLAHQPRAGAALRAQYDLIVADDFQDIEPAQVATLAALSRAGSDLVAVGDPDQAMYGFRGSAVSGITEFSSRFARGPVPAPVIVLGRARRCSAAVAGAATRIMAPTSLAPLPAALLRKLRAPSCEVPGGEVSAEIYPSSASQAAGIADRLVRAHAGGIGWSQMAVLVRTPSGVLDQLKRALAEARVPVQLRAGDLPLGEQPAVSALLALLSAVATAGTQGGPGAPCGHGGEIGDVAELLCGPVGRLDRSSVRMLRAELERAHRKAAGRAEAPDCSGACDDRGLTLNRGPSAGRPPTLPIAAVTPLASRDVLSWAIQWPEEAVGLLDRSAVGAGDHQRPDQECLDQECPDQECPDQECPVHPRSPYMNADGASADRSSADQSSAEHLSAGHLSAEHTDEVRQWLAGLSRVAKALRAGRDVLAAGGRPAEAVWAIWVSTDWPDRLRARALRGGPAGLRADADLDAVIGLFEFAARMPAQVRGFPGAQALVAAVASQEVPIDLRAGHRPQRDAVTLASAHAGRGRSWELVVLAGVQEGVWPDARPRSQLLLTDQLGPDRIGEPSSIAQTVAGERRLFYAACTRAGQQLVVTAVKDVTARPSRFLGELGVPIAIRCDVRLPAVSQAGVISRLRALCGSADPVVAQGARERLARLAQVRDAAGRPLIPLADPGNWWFAQPTTTSSPVNLDGAGNRNGRITLSGSTVAAVSRCPLRWFLERRCGASAPVGPAVEVGLLMHEAAHTLCLPGVAERPREQILAHLEQLIDQGWGRISFPAGYLEQSERRRVSQMLGSLVDWHLQSGRRPLASELRFDVGLVAGGHRVRLVGAIDRVDADADGGLHLVDFKTGKNPVSRQAAVTDAQLAMYQVAVRNGALGCLGGRESLGGRETLVGSESLVGAQLLYLARPQASSGLPTVREQPALPSGPGWAEELLGQVASVIAEGKLVARVSQACQNCQFDQICPASVGGGDDEESQQ